ncbi:MAG: LacI family transcriptional regulator [Paraglaciecola sp.]|jgi:LacI family transcriptional regulator
MATVYDVARHAGLSIATVSRVYNDSLYVSAKSKAKVLKSAKALNYVPHAGARSLMSKKTDTIGVVLPDMHGEFFSELIRGIDQGARSQGMHMLVSCSHDSSEEITTVLNALRGRVDGLLIMSSVLDFSTIGKIFPADFPIILINNHKVDTNCAKIGIDNYRGAYQMVKHLYNQACKKIFVIAGPKNNNDSVQRLQGITRAVDEFPGLSVVDVAHGDFTDDSGYKIAERIADKIGSIDAIFALNDMMAIGCVRFFADKSITIPNDVKLAGFDGIPLSQYCAPSLTTIKVPIFELGQQALQLLIQELTSKDKNASKLEILLLPTLVVRQSTHR